MSKNKDTKSFFQILFELLIDVVAQQQQDLHLQNLQ